MLTQSGMGLAEFLLLALRSRRSRAVQQPFSRSEITKNFAMARLTLWFAALNSAASLAVVPGEC